MATISKATLTIRLSSSYVLISIILSAGSDRMKSTSPGCPGKYIRLGRCRPLRPLWWRAEWFCNLVLKISRYCHIIYLTREPLVSVHLTAGSRAQKVAPYFTRAGALLFACNVDNKSYNSAKHNYKLEKFLICNHKHQPPFLRPVADVTPQRFSG